MIQIAIPIIAAIAGLMIGYVLASTALKKRIEKSNEQKTKIVRRLYKNKIQSKKNIKNNLTTTL